MEVQIKSRLLPSKKEKWRALLTEAALFPDEEADSFALVFDGEVLVAAGQRKENLLKCLAVKEENRGEGLLAKVVTALREDAAASGHRHLFLYTKPENEALFTPLFFYPVAKTEKALLMENKPDGIASFLASLPEKREGERVGCAVMNCNPFTLGHRYLVEQGAEACDVFYVFVLSEDASEFSAADRMEMVRRGVSHLDNVTVLPTGPYLISRATFPTYFLKQREEADQVLCQMDVEIFCRYFAPRLGITHRFVGEEPLSPTTAAYNDALEKALPQRGVTLHRIPRLEREGEPVSASRFRALWAEGKGEALDLVPESTSCYLKEKNL